MARDIIGKEADIHAASTDWRSSPRFLGRLNLLVLMKDYGIDIDPKHAGCFSVVACLKGVSKALIGELVAKQSVA